MKKIQGLTLIEVLITVLIISILASVAGPSFFQSFDNRKVASAAEELYSNLQLVRSEALTRSKETSITFAGLGTTSWSYGLTEGASCTPTAITNTAAGACVFNIDDGDGIFDADDDNVVHRVDNSNYEGVQLAMTIGNVNSIQVDPARGTMSRIETMTFTSELGSKVSVIIGILGNIKICSDDLVDYKACS